MWTDVPDPVLSDGEVLVETYAAALNRADLMQRAGNILPLPDVRNGQVGNFGDH